MSSNSTIQNLIKQFQKLPSVGAKTAQRFAFALLRDSADGNLEQLEIALKKARETINICKKCYNIAEGDFCEICNNPSRDARTICVVEEALDLIPIEECGEFSGIYYVLGTGEKVRTAGLISRIKESAAAEIIIASSPSAEGEATALKLQKIITEHFGSQIKITRLGRGLPTGSDIKYADSETIRGALRGRQRVYPSMKEGIAV